MLIEMLFGLTSGIAVLVRTLPQDRRTLARTELRKMRERMAARDQIAACQSIDAMLGIDPTEAGQ